MAEEALRIKKERLDDAEQEMEEEHRTFKKAARAGAHTPGAARDTVHWSVTWTILRVMRSMTKHGPPSHCGGSLAGDALVRS